ncbi:heat shock protein 70 [Micromonas commoda]|uniref:Heat shock protein 70 n=1 Tax=Micromonas commoda (strain RCC299 / NOUM17 / CCMP2709) TaxID=296587 RepID=C1FH19_MICCC|nr:heat shock protein 70 [Micromonas commoda]ACO69747.1 heat shock protein 70 [Micromonas commoda]|eukprot:XP_002508489.1 heat shock protein 70 [Micromonas commoda]
MRSSLGRFLLAAVALLLCCATAARAAVLGIDYGSEYVKVSIVAPGRTPISIVINEISKRKSTAAVAFTGGDRWLAEEAMNYNARYPERVFTRLRDLLGKDASVESFAEYLAKYKLPYKVVRDADRGTARVVSETGDEYAVEELVAMILQYAMKIGEGMGKGQIKDAVVAIPPYFGQTHRYSLYDAADVAGLNILAEVSDLSCAALQWGIDKDFNQKGTWTIIYDLGATSAGAALVRYSTFEGKDAGKKKQHGQFEIKAVKWDESVGGEDMDMLLVDHFLAEFDAKHKPSVSAFDSPKAIAKLRKQVRKTKEILSANKEAPLSVEGMHEDVDFRSTITRKDFEALAKEKGIFTRAAGPLKAIVDSLADFDITLKDIEVVEAIGGATRVPGVKKALSEALDGRALDFHLDADEAVAMGAGLFAANMSTTFRMRKFGAADAAPYALEVDLGKGPEHDRKTLLPLHKRFPVRRVVSVANATEDAKFTVHHADPTRLPPGIVDAKVAEFAIAGVPDAMKKHDKVGDIKAHFAVDSSGILYLEKAEYVVEVVDMVEVPDAPLPEDGDATARDQPDASADADAEEKEKEEPKEEQPDASAAPPPAPEEPKFRQRRRVFRIPLTVTESGRAVPAMTPDAVKKSIGVLKDLAAKDEAKRAQEAAKSNLEAYIYSIREKVYEDEGIAKVTDEAMREKFSGELTDAEDWIYDGGEHATAVEFNNRRDKLQSVGDEWIHRAKELTRRPAAVEKAKDFIATARKTVEKLGETKPWIEDDAKKKMLDDVDGFESWLNEKVALQEKKKDTESAAFTAAEVTVEAKPLEAKLVRLKKTPAPKPPPPPPAPEKEETDAEAPAAAEGDAAEGEDPAAEGEEGADGATAEEGADGAEATDGGEGEEPYHGDELKK